MSALKIYRSDDPAAPTLSGTAGSFVELLDAILVSGYGVGEYRVDPCGWSIAYMSTHRRAYRNHPVEGSGGFLAIDDRGTGLTDARSARARAYELMVDIDTGQVAAPPLLDTPAGVWIPKSHQLNSSARGWVAVGNETRFLLSIDVPNHGISDGGWIFLAGDWLEPFSTADVAVFGLTSSNRETNHFRWTGTVAASNSMGALSLTGLQGSGDYEVGTSLSGQSFLTTRPPDQLEQLASNGFATVHSSLTSSQNQNRVGGIINALPYPALWGGVMISPIYLVYEGQPRGLLKGAYAPLHAKPFNHLDPLESIPGFRGNTLLPVNTREGPSTSSVDGRFGQILLDITSEL